MAGKFERKRFSEIDLNDSFFDSLKADYPGTSSSTDFVQWFTKKAAEGKRALVFEDDQGVGAFVNLKPGETEEISISATSANHSLSLAVGFSALDALPLIWNITTPCSPLLTLLIPCRSALTSAWQMG